MQVTEKEINLPFHNHIAISRRDLLSICIFGILLLSGSIVLFISNIELMNLSVLLIILALLILLPSGTALVMIMRHEHSCFTYFVRINREGFSFSHLFGVAISPLVVKWSEIAALVPYTYTYLGHSINTFGVVPHDLDAMIAQIVQQKSKGLFSRFLMKANVYFYRRSKSLSPLNIPSVILPVSIDELVVMIQERFASELNAHHIIVRNWQNM